MAQKIVYECDRCGARREHVAPVRVPDGWVIIQAEVSGGVDEDDDVTVEKLFCAACWRSLSEPIPRAAEHR